MIAVIPPTVFGLTYGARAAGITIPAVAEAAFVLTGVDLIGRVWKKTTVTQEIVKTTVIAASFFALFPAATALALAPIMLLITHSARKAVNESLPGCHPRLSTQVKVVLLSALFFSLDPTGGALYFIAGTLVNIAEYGVSHLTKNEAIQQVAGAMLSGVALFFSGAGRWLALLSGGKIITVGSDVLMERLMIRELPRTLSSGRLEDIENWEFALKIFLWRPDGPPKWARETMALLVLTKEVIEVDQADAKALFHRLSQEDPNCQLLKDRLTLRFPNSNLCA